MLERNADNVDLPRAIRQTRSLHPREAVRALADRVLEATGDALSDDATVLCLDWHGDHGRDRASDHGAEKGRASAGLHLRTFTLRVGPARPDRAGQSCAARIRRGRNAAPPPRRRDGCSTDGSGCEPGPAKHVPAAVQSSLSGIAAVIDHQRMKVDPPAPRGRELDPVRPPVGLDAVVQVAQDLQDFVRVVRVVVQVKVAVRSRLPPDERVNSPPSSSQNRQPTERTASRTLRTSAELMPS